MASDRSFRWLACITLTGCSWAVLEEVTYTLDGVPELDLMALPLAPETRCWETIDGSPSERGREETTATSRMGLTLEHLGFAPDGTVRTEGEPRFVAEVEVTRTRTTVFGFTCEDFGTGSLQEEDYQREYGMNAGLYEAAFGSPPDAAGWYPSSAFDATRPMYPWDQPIEASDPPRREVAVTCPDGTGHTASIIDDVCETARTYLAMVEACGLSEQEPSACWSVAACGWDIDPDDCEAP